MQFLSGYLGQKNIKTSKEVLQIEDGIKVNQEALNLLKVEKNEIENKLLESINKKELMNEQLRSYMFFLDLVQLLD